MSHEDVNVAARLVVECARVLVPGKCKANSALAAVTALLVDAGMLAAVGACTRKIPFTYNVLT